jgi:hypothetical protein
VEPPVPVSCGQMGSEKGDKTKLRDISPILHTVWLGSHALTLTNYTAKYYEVRKI